jgi:hypothetical protein
MISIYIGFWTGFQSVVRHVGLQLPDIAKVGCTSLSAKVTSIECVGGGAATGQARVVAG